MTRPNFAVALILLILPVLTTGCGDSESEGYHEITASVDSLPTTAEVEDESPAAASNDAAAAAPGEQLTDDSTAGQATSNDAATAEPTKGATGTEPANVAAVEPRPAADLQPAATSDPEDAAPAADPTAQPVTPEKPAEENPKREIKLLIPSKTFAAEGPDEAVRVSFDDIDLLKVLNMDPVIPKAPELMPDWLKQLDGKRIRIRGFMFPPFSETGIQAFTLARDTQICCFGRNPLPYDLVDVFLRKGAETDYLQLRPFDVVGVFHIGEEIEPGYLYSIDDAVVIE